LKLIDSAGNVQGGAYGRADSKGEGEHPTVSKGGVGQESNVLIEGTIEGVNSARKTLWGITGGKKTHEANKTKNPRCEDALQGKRIEPKVLCDGKHCRKLPRRTGVRKHRSGSNQRQLMETRCEKGCQRDYAGIPARAGQPKRTILRRRKRSFGGATDKEG